MRFEGRVKWRNHLLCALSNSVGLIAIMALQYGCLAATGTVFWTTEWLYVNMLDTIIPLMFMLPYFNRSFYMLTGRVWLGPMVTVMVFIMISLTNSVAYTPYFPF
jgi:hypothetical protein